MASKKLIALWLGLCAACAQVTAVANPPAPATPTAALASLAGTEWVLTTLNGQSLAPQTYITIRFTSTHATGFAGCNMYGGSYALSAEDALSVPGFDITAMGCLTPEGVMEQEEAYMKTLGRVHTYRLNDDQLELTDAEGNSLLTFIRQPDDPMNLDELSGTEWRLVGWRGPDLTGGALIPDSSITLAFTTGAVRGHAGCRDYMGQYVMDEAGFHFTYMEMQGEATGCSEALIIQEGDYTTRLGWATHYRQVAGQLELLTAQGEVLVFEPIEEQTITTPTPPPTQTQTPTLTPISNSLTTLLFTGDINLGRCVYAFSKAANDMALPFRGLAETLKNADITVGSLDGSISDYNPVPPCEEFHRNLLAPSETVQGLTFAGFDVMTVATNHAADCGLERGCDYESLLDTVKHLRAAGIAPVGGGANLAEAMAPVILTVNGTRFAFIGVSAINNSIWATETTPGTGPFETKIYTEAIRAAKEHADVVIVLAQWGREFSEQITWLQAAGAQKMVDAGAMLIIGNNPHRVQGVQTFPNGAVAAYALGNFVFDQEWSDGTLYTIQGLLLKATFQGKKLHSIELIPIRIYDNFQPHLAPPEEAAQILLDVERSMSLGPGD